MLSATAALRRLIGHNIYSNLSKISTGSRFGSKLTSTRFANHGQILFSARNIHALRKYQPVAFFEQSYRPYSTGAGKGDKDGPQDAEGHDDDDDDTDDDDYFENSTQRLPAIFAVPEVWPRLPIIVNQGSTLFPNYMKVFDVCLLLFVSRVEGVTKAIILLLLRTGHRPELGCHYSREGETQRTLRGHFQ